MSIILNYLSFLGLQGQGELRGTSWTGHSRAILERPVDLLTDISVRLENLSWDKKGTLKIILKICIFLFKAFYVTRGKKSCFPCLIWTACFSDRLSL